MIVCLVWVLLPVLHSARITEYLSECAVNSKLNREFAWYENVVFCAEGYALGQWAGGICFCRQFLHDAKAPKSKAVLKSRVILWGSSIVQNMYYTNQMPRPEPSDGWIGHAATWLDVLFSQRGTPQCQCATVRIRQWPEVSDFVARFCTLR